MAVVVSLFLAALMLGGIYVLISLGLQLIFGVMRVVNFAHGVFLMVGGYIALELTQMGQNPLVGIIPAMIVLFALGYFIQRVLLENVLYDLEMNSILLTFGIALILESGLRMRYGNTPRFVSYYNESITLLSGSVGLNKIIGGVGGFLFAGALFALLRYTDIGRSIRATSQSPDLAEACGVNSVNVRSLTFAIGSLLAAAGGVLYLVAYQISPFGGLHLVLLTFVVITLAGFGSLRGTVLAGIIVAFLQTYAGFYIATEAAFAILYLGVLAILLVKPTGLFGIEEGATA